MKLHVACLNVILNIPLADPVGVFAGVATPPLNFQKKIVVIRVAVVIDRCDRMIQNELETQTAVMCICVQRRRAYVTMQITFLTRKCPPVRLALYYMFRESPASLSIAMAFCDKGLIGVYRENAIVIESEAKYPFGGNVYYVTMRMRNRARFATSGST